MANYITSYKGYAIYKDIGGGYWCQKGYRDQCWDKDFPSLSEIKKAIDEEIADFEEHPEYNPYEW